MASQNSSKAGSPAPATAAAGPNRGGTKERRSSPTSASRSSAQNPEATDTKGEKKPKKVKGPKQTPKKVPKGNAQTRKKRVGPILSVSDARRRLFEVHLLIEMSHSSSGAPKAGVQATPASFSFTEEQKDAVGAERYSLKKALKGAAWDPKDVKISADTGFYDGDVASIVINKKMTTYVGDPVVTELLEQHRIPLRAYEKECGSRNIYEISHELWRLFGDTVPFIKLRYRGSPQPTNAPAWIDVFGMVKAAATGWGYHGETADFLKELQRVRDAFQAHNPKAHPLYQAEERLYYMWLLKDDERFQSEFSAQFEETLNASWKVKTDESTENKKRLQDVLETHETGIEDRASLCRVALLGPQQAILVRGQGTMTDFLLHFKIKPKTIKKDKQVALMEERYYNAMSGAINRRFDSPAYFRVAPSLAQARNYVGPNEAAEALKKKLLKYPNSTASNVDRAEVAELAARGETRESIKAREDAKYEEYSRQRDASYAPAWDPSRMTGDR